MNSDILKSWDFTLEILLGQDLKIVYFKGGFYIENVNGGDVQVRYMNENIDKYFPNIRSAMYWCEGRMFEKDLSIKDIKFVDVSKFSKVELKRYFETNMKI